MSGNATPKRCPISRAVSHLWKLGELGIFNPSIVFSNPDSRSGGRRNNSCI
jgi:hypothetical protein